ncbi:MAG TPA: DUF2750 domain-containing protein [Actinoplanes sp.]|nr:DUF2750 domain-containing protein [Actinoplanes sp.]
MSLSGAHRSAFRREVPLEGRVYSIRDGGGFPISRATDGTRAVPFWSRESRARKVVDQVAAYRTFDVVAIDMTEWLDRWLPDLERDGVLAGLNWAGPRATGYDMAPGQIAGWLAEVS